MSQDNKGTTRREFLRNAAVTAAATAAATNIAKSSVYSLAPSKVLGANDKIIVGHVGMGGQGQAHMRFLKTNATDQLNNNTEQVGVCDLYGKRLAQAQKYLGLKDTQAFLDYRKLLENKDINAVWVTTSDQWHAQIAIDALNAGKHVYVEKPMCKTLEEAFAIYDAAKKSGCLVQVGSQGCSDPKYKAVAKLVQSGKYGTMIVSQGCYNRNSIAGEWQYDIDPNVGPKATGENYIDWETFRKGAGTPEFDPDMFFRWRKWWQIGSGVVGDLIPHRLHPHFIAAGLPIEGDGGFPMRVSSLGGLYVQKINAETKKQDRNVPDFINLNVDFPGGPSMMFMSSTCTEQGWVDTVRLNKATITFGGDKVELKPERVWADEVEDYEEQVPGGEPIERHERNLLDAIRGVAKQNAGIELAVRVQTIISLGELSFRNGVTMHFDPKTRKAWSGNVTDPYSGLDEKY